MPSRGKRDKRKDGEKNAALAPKAIERNKRATVDGDVPRPRSVMAENVFGSTRKPK